MNKLCMNCVYLVPDTVGWNTKNYQIKYGICSRTSTVTPESGNTCQSERAAPFFHFNRCGEKARFFQEETK
jgi:hypothetical protein